MTRDQFEALVRAEALKELPGVAPKFDPFHQVGIRIEDITWGIIETSRSTYIAARMEHEWPVVEALQDIIEDLNTCDWTCARCGEDYRMPDTDIHLRATEALSPYTTKPIER